MVMGAQGRVVIPAEFRRALGIEPGTRLVVRIEDDHLVVEKAAAVEARIRAMFAGVEGGVDDLIAERRREAEREDRMEADWQRRREARREG